MVDIVIEAGLIYNGEIITGNVISALTPEKITYSGSDADEEAQVRKWAKKAKAQFTTKGGSSKKVEKPVEKLTEKVEEPTFQI